MGMDLQVADTYLAWCPTLSGKVYNAAYGVDENGLLDYDP